MRVSTKVGALFGAVALLAVTAHAGFAPDVSVAQSAPKPASATKSLFDGYVAADKFPGIVAAFAKGDAPATFVAAGRIAAEPSAPAASPDSLWRVYSMTKPITGIAAMMLIEEGKIGLDQPVSDFIPSFKDQKVLIDPDKGLESRPAARPVTVRHLLTHTAGLGYTIITKGPLLKEYERLGITPAAFNAVFEAQARLNRPASLEEFANRVGTLPLLSDPGTKWSYSISLDVLGRVIEVASGMSFDRFLEARLFKPLKMDSTWFTVPESEAGRLATNYTFVGDTRIAADPGPTSIWLSPPSFPYGGAGLISSARDYDRFLHMLANEGELDGVRVLKPETVRLAMSNLLPEGVAFGGVPGATGGTNAPKMGFGAGGSVYLEDAAGAGKGTYGWGGAAGTVAWVDPKNKVRGTIMANYMPSDRYPVRQETVPAIYADLAR